MNEETKKKPFKERAKEKIKKYAPWVLGLGAIAGGICWALSSVGGEDESVDGGARELLSSDSICSQQLEESDSELQSEKAERAAHGVSEHIRNLPPGCNASQEKIESATDHGYSLEPGQTWVESYTTGNKSA
jgi:hypothetical protein